MNKPNNYFRVTAPWEPHGKFIFFNHGDARSIAAAADEANRLAIEWRLRALKECNDATVVKLAHWHWYPGAPGETIA